MDYDLELGKAADEIRRQKPKLVCIQLPDGLKPEAGRIKNELEEKTGSKIIIWLGSCFGACDVPLQVKALGADLIIQFGHSPWKK
ncbi:diphthamide synthesis protein [Candidatus Woesearchaeota archaeon]|nr:diphthamide synthesis protein [Candidatus Woesearchaeota archaeon]